MTVTETNYDTDDMLYIKMGKESFELNDKEINVFGTIHYFSNQSQTDKIINWLEIQLLDDHENIVSNHFYYKTFLENKIFFNISTTSRNIHDSTKYHLKFSILGKTIIQPIRFHYNYKLYWGTIATHAKIQYEIQYLNVFNMTVNKSTHLFVRFKYLNSTAINQMNDCCLIGLKLVQCINNVDYQIVNTSTKLLTKLNNTWKQPCKLDLSLINNDMILVPTTTSRNIKVQHYIDITFTFTSNNQTKGHTFPISVIGYNTDSNSSISISSSGSSIMTEDENSYQHHIKD